MFTPLTLDPTLLVVTTWQEVEEEFEPQLQIGRVAPTNAYAIKTLLSGDPETANELSMAAKLNSLQSLTQAFPNTHGFLLCTDAPPQMPAAPPGEAHVLLFSDRIDATFDELPDDPKHNEDCYFQLLIGLYYARKRLKFTHWDIHNKQIMFTRLPQPQDTTFPIGSFFVTLENTAIEAKLIDYGKSAACENFSEEEWEEPQFKKMWSKSDIYHLSLIFSHRNHLNQKMHDFLHNIVLPQYRAAMYAQRLENDSATNYQNIEALLRLYFVDTDGGLTQ